MPLRVTISNSVFDNTGIRKIRMFVYDLNVSMTLFNYIIFCFIFEGTIFTPSLDDRIKALPNYDEVHIC